MSRFKGFTLIELVVTILVLAILGIIATPKFLNLKSDSKQATIISVGAAMESAALLVYSQAIIAGQEIESAEIVINQTTVPLFNGYPAVNGRDGFTKLNAQVQAWLDIDSVGKPTIIANPDAAPFFIDKSSSQNQIYIFFSSAPKTGNRTEYGCQVRYQNPVGGEPSVRVLTDEC